MKDLPKIVVLDGYPLNPGDLSWQKLEELGEVVVYPRTAPEEVIERAKDADIIIINKVKIEAELLDNLPNLKYIGITATGYNNLDMKAVNMHNIFASNIPDYGSFGVAQHAMALLLSITNRVHPHFDDVKSEKWKESKDFSYTNGSIIELADKTIGLVGLGKIGYKMGVMAEAMGMFVSYYARHPYQSSWEYYDTLNDMLENSDVVSLHIPLTEETHELINSNTLSKMKRNAILINTSRGALVNEVDLHNALNNGNIGGAGLDVLNQEPPPSDHILLSSKNCIITPHNAWASKESRQRIMNILADNLKSYLEGNPTNLID